MLHSNHIGYFGQIAVEANLQILLLMVYQLPQNLQHLMLHRQWQATTKHIPQPASFVSWLPQMAVSGVNSVLTALIRNLLFFN
uniref:Uncharacterized protein n=1 Tax=Rhodnius prolixus TaxID=13249 RepID=T1HYG7_RHOPR